MDIKDGDGWVAGFVAVRTEEYEELLGEALNMLEEYEKEKLNEDDERVVALLTGISRTIKRRLNYIGDKRDKQRLFNIYSIILKISLGKLEKEVMGVN